MAKVRRVRRNPTGTLLVNSASAKKTRRVHRNGHTISRLLARLTGRHKRRNPLSVNPSHKRRNPLSVNPIRIRRRKNPNMGSMVERMEYHVGRIPLIGGMLAGTVGVLGSVLGGAIGVLPTAYLLPMISKKVTLPNWFKPYAFSAGGAAISGLVSILPSFPYKQQVIVGIAAAGGAVDTYRKITGKSQDLGEYGSLLLGDDMGDDDMGDDDMGDDAFSEQEFGEEMDAMGIDDIGAPGAACEWADADLGDMDFCGDDLSADEIDNASLGRRHYYSAYGDLDGDLDGEELGRKAVRGPYKRRSRHAGKPGQRWGWLIMWIGMDQFQELCKLPAPQRMNAINKLKAQAKETARKLISAGKPSTMEQVELSGLLMAA